MQFSKKKKNFSILFHGETLKDNHTFMNGRLPLDDKIIIRRHAVHYEAFQTEGGNIKLMSDSYDDIRKNLFYYAPLTCHRCYSQTATGL